MMDYKQKYSDPKIHAFIQYMVYGTYASMDIEGEAVLAVDTLYDRYKIYIDGMISRGVHTNLVLRDRYGP